MRAIAGVSLSILLAAAAPLPLTAQARPTVDVTVTATVPPGTADTVPVFLAGNLLSPAWRADGLRMQRSSATLYTVTLSLTAGAQLEYKFTRGTWQGVEKNAAGGDIANRRLRIEAGVTVADTVARWGIGSASASGPTAVNSLTGTFREHNNFASTHLANPRNVLIYLPPGYDADASVRYPVLYMHDGQNVFNRATAFGGREWEVDETAERLIAEQRIEPIIIVAISNTGARMTEYTPEGESPAPGRSGTDYANFLVSELKPFIDNAYRTKSDRDNTAVAGSSLGGLISLTMALSHPNVFGKAGVVSPSLFWNDRQLLKEVERLAPSGILSRSRLWVDMGTREGGVPPGDSITTSLRNARQLAELLRATGSTHGREYFYLEVPDGEHNESWWARRVDQMLLFLFGRSRPDAG